jgi:hypothetical protein
MARAEGWCNVDREQERQAVIAREWPILRSQINHVTKTDCMQEITDLISDFDPVGAVHRSPIPDKVRDHVARTDDCLQRRNLKVRALDTLFIDSIDVAEHVEVKLWHRALLLQPDT